MRSRQRRQRWRSLAAATLIGLVCIGDSAAFANGDERRLAVVGAQSLGVNLAPASKGYEGSLTVTVRNDADYEGPLAVRLITRGLGDAKLTHDSAPPTKGIALYDPSKAGPAIARRDVVVLDLRLRAAKAPADPLTGVLVIGTPSGRVSPATAEVSASVPAASRWTKAQLEPAAVEFTRDFCHPHWPLGWDCAPPHPVEVTVTGLAPGKSIKKGDVIASVTAGGDAGGTANAALVAAGDIGPNATSGKARLEVNHLTRRGNYETKLAIDPSDEKAPSLSVKITAADWWPWPLAVLLAGALVGWLGILYSEKDRPKRVLKQALTAAADRYRADKRAAKDAPAPYDLDSVFPARDTWSCPAAEPAARQLYCQIEQAPDNEALQEYASRVAAMQAQAESWNDVRQQADALRAAVDPVREIGAASAIVVATDALLSDQDPPKDAAGVAAFEKSLADQTEAVTIWRAAWDVYERAQALFDKLSGESDGTNTDRASFVQHNPEALLDVYLAAAVNLADLRDSNTLGLLRENLRWLEAIELAQPDIRPAMSRAAAARPWILALGGAETSPPAVAARSRPSRPMSQQLLNQIRTADRVSFWITAGVATLAYFVTIYPATTFGSVWQYLTAFAAGAGTQLAINWRLLPWWRSYKPTLASAAASSDA